MRFSDPVAPTARQIVETCVVVAFTLALMFVAFGLDRPGYALLTLAAVLSARIAYVRWRRAT